MLHEDPPPPRSRGDMPSVVRIELFSKHRRHLAKMAKEAGVPADVLAARLLVEVIEDDAKAHGGGG